MPRRPRLLLDGGYYHIVTRGNDKRLLFRHQKDYNYFLGVIRRYLGRFQVYIYNYCIMPNHIHLLVQTKRAEDLPKFMQGILQVYANYFRGNYKSFGFVFQNRYKSNFIEKDSYLLECGRYIERNPLRAKITENLLSYPWSSFSFYAKGLSDDIIKMANPLYLEFGDTREECRHKYQDYVLAERPYETIVDKEFRLR